MTNKPVKLENVKEESVTILSSRYHNGFPLLTCLTVKYIQNEYKRTHIMTNNRYRWEKFFSDSIAKDKYDIWYHELFNIQSISNIECKGDLLVLDNASYCLDKFGSQDTLSLLLKSKVCLSLLHRDLLNDSIITSLKYALPYFIHLDVLEGEYVTITLHSRPPRLQKQLETYNISPSLHLTSTVSTVSENTTTITQAKQPSSTFRLETNEDEDAERTLLANPFLRSEEPVSQYLAGRGSSDSESDPDDDLNI